ncbi:MAG: hypothetical protein H0V40_04095, partial [Actinobacteria bacterium]|nr:hypothetical protein [Actinomycetota bacterium]
MRVVVCMVAAVVSTLTLATSCFAQAQQMRVEVVAPFALERFAGRGAVGLLVPGAGPSVDRAGALAALVRGRLEHSLLGRAPEGDPVIELGGEPGAATILVSLPPQGAGGNTRRYPIAIVGAGWRGLLTSRSTRIPGLVSIVDVAPTALGRPDGLSTQRASDAPAALRELDRRIDRNGSSRLPATVLAGAVIALLALVRPRAAVIAFATVAAANLLLGLTAVSGRLAVIAIVAASAAAAVPLERALRTPLRLGLALAAVVVAYALVLAVAPESVALSPL